MSKESAMRPRESASSPAPSPTANITAFRASATRRTCCSLWAAAMAIPCCRGARDYTWPMRFLRLRPPRTVLTVLLTLAIGFTLAEEVVADVHDGGATHAEIDRATGVNHADEQGEAGAAFHSDPAGGPAESDHPAHVCHCTHAHG